MCAVNDLLLTRVATSDRIKKSTAANINVVALSCTCACAGEEEHGWNSPDAGKATALIVIPGGGEAGRQACIKRAEELEVFIQCHEQVREHVRVTAYDSRVNKHEKLDRRKDANIIVLTMDCLRAEVRINATF